MLGIILDAAAIMFIIYLVNQGQEMSFGPAVISAIVISFGTLACVLLLSQALGIFSLAPALPLAIAVIWMVSGIPLGRAAIAGAVFTAYKVGMVLVLTAMST